ncbi:heterokaryon incompatibility protein-domain-containing protein [Paraphoma chrysanthemicola]|uniref:Heterokaryon incompatibility protein-domain-containing protein n=1 Tax=Paraphoma chrysanthemicola TaxID=798071 RepID=A0A8K0RIZ2_9PLEO|nr:heterokaryon incompatibility protein-domain-containing protein [Paraphoma chrysanthemicola]
MEPCNPSFIPQSSTVSALYDDLRVASRCIRLVRVHALAETATEDAPIQCQVYVADLDASPVYTTLSYVWGTYSSPPDRVLCNNIPVPITSNCHSALRHLRTINGSFDVWIDAICINQENREEKHQQIGLMGDIYSQASQTFIWLGAGSSTTDRVMGFLNRVEHLQYFFEQGDVDKPVLRKLRSWAAQLFYTKNRYRWDRSTLPHQTSRKSVTKIESESTKCTEDELADFLNCAWISRIWTYQEFLFSSNCFLVCGHAMASMHRIQYHIIYLANAHDRLEHDLRPWLAIIFTRDMYRVRATRARDYNSPLLDYWRFWYKVTQDHLYWFYTLKLLILYAISIVILLPYRTLIPEMSINVSTVLVVVGVVFLVALVTQALLFVWAAVQSTLTHTSYDIGLRYRLPPSDLTGTKSYLQSSFHGRILEILCTRNATEPRDMSFGLDSILRRNAANSDSLVVNYSLSQAEVYSQLTRHFLQETNSFGVLEMAAQRHCPGAPSWIPDYSQKLEYPSGPTDGHDATNGCKAYYRFHPDDPQILIVKGYIGKTVTIVKPLEQDPRPQAKQPSHEPRYYIETAICKGTSYQQAQVGDKVALIAGMDVPVIVRGDGHAVKLVAPAILQYKFATNKIDGTYSRNIMLGHAWNNYDRDRRRKWVQEQRDIGVKDVDALELDPAVYLDDVLIS